MDHSKMAELLFETCGVPSIAYGVDAAFSYKYNQRHGVCDKDGLAICPGFTTTHVILFIVGEPVQNGICRTSIGGYHITDYMKQLLSLKYPHHMARFTWEKVEDLKVEHCYIAPDYVSESRLFQKEAKEAEDKTRMWQLPCVPPPTEEPSSEEEIARKAAIKEKQGQRLQEMAEAKRSSRMNELDNESHRLEFLLKQLEQVEEPDIPSFLSATSYVSKKEVESALVKLKEKKRQLFLKTTSEGQQRAKQKRHEEELDLETRNQQDEKKRLYVLTRDFF